MAVTLDDKLLDYLSDNNYFSDGLDVVEIRDNRADIKKILSNYLFKNNFDTARPQQKAHYLEEALKELKKHQSFTVKHQGKNIPYEDWLDTLSEANKQDAIQKIGEPLGFEKSFAQKKSALNKFVSGEKGLNSKYHDLTAKHNPLLNLWDTTVGRGMSSAYRALFQPTVSWVKREWSTGAQQRDLGGWGALTAGVATIAGFCFLTAATGGLGAIAWLPTVAGVLGVVGAVFTGRQTKKAWEAYQIAKVEAEDKQLEDDATYYQQQQDYMNGGSISSSSITAAQNSFLSIELGGVTEGAFSGKGAKLNIRDSSIRPSREVWQKYGDELTLAFNPSGSVIVGIKSPDKLSDKEIQTMLDAVKQDCGIENAPVSSVTILGERQGNNSLLNISDKFKAIDSRLTAQKATAILQKELAAQAEAAATQKKTFDEKFEKIIGKQGFIENAVSAALVGYITDPTAANNGGYAIGALKVLGQQDTELAEFIENRALQGGDISYHNKINEAVAEYLDKNFNISPNNQYPMTTSAAAIAKYATEQLFPGSSSSESDRVKALITAADTKNPSPTSLALMISTGLRTGHLNGILDLREAWSKTGATQSDEDRFKKLTKSQQELAEKIANAAQLSGNYSSDKAAAAMDLIDDAMNSAGAAPTTPLSEEEELFWQARAGSGRNP